MILATDVHYTQSIAVAAGVLFENWSDPEPKQEYLCEIQTVEPYESGNFYKRELPCLIELLKTHNISVDCIVVDGYVYLDDDFRPGLGKHLFDSLGGFVTVIGVAKTAYQGIKDANAIRRGKSKNPLYVTSTGNIDEAKRYIVQMHGDYRVPTLLKRVDSLCRIG